MAEIQATLAHFLEDRLDYLFVHPFFNPGGSEVVTLATIRALEALRPRMKVGLLTTDPYRSGWLDRIPRRVRTLELARKHPSLARTAIRRALAAALLEHPPQVIHNVNSDPCWRIYASHGRDLSRNSWLIASSYLSVPDARGNLFSDPGKYLDSCRKYLKLILTENRAHAEELRSRLHFDRTRLIHAPVQTSFRRPQARRGKLRVLWASRWNVQKSPQTLYLISLFNPQYRFGVYASLVPDQLNASFNMLELSRLPNVKIEGAFRRFDEIPADQYDAFLYTSRWDGMPNILLEAGAKGLPIVAPDVGGIRELISERTGFLVSDPSAVDEYSHCLAFIQAHPAEARRRAIACQSLLKKRHSREAYESRFRSLLQELGL